MNLETTWLGLRLRNPLIVAACPLTRECHQLERLEQAGAAAVVMYSLFAEQVACDELSHVGLDQANGNAGTASLESTPLPNQYLGGLDAYLRHIELARKSVLIPVVASLNGCRMGDWVRFARQMEQAGASALELNVYFVPTDPSMTGSEVEQQYVDIVTAVRDQIRIPLSIKLGPFFSSLPNMAARLEATGVDGLVLFNRFLQPDINVDTFDVAPRLSLSTRDELRLPLRWIALLRSQLSLSLASSSGAHQAEDVIKLLLAGADAISVASTLLRHGVQHLTTVLDDLEEWMKEKDFISIEQFQGLIHSRPGTDMTAFERSNYIQTIIGYDEEHQG